MICGPGTSTICSDVRTHYDIPDNLLQGLRHNDIDDLLPSALQQALLDLLHCDVLDTLQDEVASVRNKPLSPMVPTQRTRCTCTGLPRTEVSLRRSEAAHQRRPTRDQQHHPHQERCTS